MNSQNMINLIKKSIIDRLDLSQNRPDKEDRHWIKSSL